MAEYLTEFELQRTQTEFDDSLTLKIYLLQFINYYASIFYIAFFKGKVIGSPKRYNKIFGYRQEEVSNLWIKPLFNTNTVDPRYSSTSLLVQFIIRTTC